MHSWKVIKFDPFTHEVTSFHRGSGETIRFIVPPEHRTPEKSRAFVDAVYEKHTPGEVKPDTKEHNKYKYLFMLAVALLGIDVLLRAYGI